MAVRGGDARYQGNTRDKDFSTTLVSEVSGAFTIIISRAPAEDETLLLDSTVGLPDIDEDDPNANHTWAGLVTGDVPACVPVEAPSKR